MRIELEHYEKIEGEALELDGKANKLSQMIRANLPAAMQGLVVVPLFAGYDLRRKQGRMWKFDVTGGRYEETEFEATGSFRADFACLSVSLHDAAPVCGSSLWVWDKHSHL